MSSWSHDRLPLNVLGAGQLMTNTCVWFASDPHSGAEAVRALASLSQFKRIVFRTDLAEHPESAAGVLAGLPDLVQLEFVDHGLVEGSDFKAVDRLLMQGICKDLSAQGRVVPVFLLHEWQPELPAVTQSWCEANEFSGVHLVSMMKRPKRVLSERVALYLQAGAKMQRALTCSHPFREMLEYGKIDYCDQLLAGDSDFSMALSGAFGEVGKPQQREEPIPVSDAGRDDSWKAFLHPVARQDLRESEPPRVQDA